MPSILRIKQNQESESATIACRVITDDDAQVTLVPGQWVTVAECDPGSHKLRVGAIVGSGYQDAILFLDGATFYDETKIDDRFSAPTDGNLYELKVL